MTRYVVVRRPARRYIVEGDVSVEEAKALARAEYVKEEPSLPISAYKAEGMNLSRWHATPWERARIITQSREESQ